MYQLIIKTILIVFLSFPFILSGQNNDNKTIKKSSQKWYKAKEKFNGVSYFISASYNSLLNSNFKNSLEIKKMKRTIWNTEMGFRFGKMPFFWDIVWGYSKFKQNDSSIVAFKNHAMHMNKFEAIMSFVILPDFPTFTPTIGIGYQYYSFSGKYNVNKDGEEGITSRFTNYMPILAFSLNFQPNTAVGYFVNFKQGISFKKEYRIMQTFNLGITFKFSRR